MMDGQVHYIREALDAQSLDITLIMAIPPSLLQLCMDRVREAENSAPAAGDRQGYQASYAESRNRPA